VEGVLGTEVDACSVSGFFPIACTTPTGMGDVSPKFSPDGLILYLAENYSMCQSIFPLISNRYYSGNKLI